MRLAATDPVCAFERAGLHANLGTSSDDAGEQFARDTRSTRVVNVRTPHLCSGEYVVVGTGTVSFQCIAPCSMTWELPAQEHALRKHLRDTQHAAYKKEEQRR